MQLLNLQFSFLTFFPPVVAISATPVRVATLEHYDELIVFSNLFGSKKCPKLAALHDCETSCYHGNYLQGKYMFLLGRNSDLASRNNPNWQPYIPATPRKKKKACRWNYFFSCVVKKKFWRQFSHFCLEDTTTGLPVWINLELL